MELFSDAGGIIRAGTAPVWFESGNAANTLPAVDLKVLSWLAAGKYLVDRAAPRLPSTGSRRRLMRIGWTALRDNASPRVIARSEATKQSIS
jgi:hypothetical protein